MAEPDNRPCRVLICPAPAPAGHIHRTGTCARAGAVADRETQAPSCLAL